MVNEILERMFRLTRLVKRMMECRRVRNPECKTILQMLLELYHYRRYWRISSALEDFFRFELYRRQTSMDDVLAYVPEVAHQRIQGLSRYREYDCLAFDKRYEYFMFKAMGLPHPEVMLFTFDGVITDNCFRRLDPATAMSLIMNSPVQRFFLKPSFSSQARGTDVISVSHGQLRRMNGTLTDLTRIVKEAQELPSGYVLQCELRNQHPAMKRLNPDTVNSLRIVTHRSGGATECCVRF